MNRFLSVSLAVALVLVTAACSSNDFVRARGTAGGPVKVEVMRVANGVEQPPFAVYEGTAGAVVTAQTTPPHFTFDKSWVQTYPPQAPRAANDEVLDRSVAPPAAPACTAGPLASCPVPTPAAPRSSPPEACSTGWQPQAAPEPARGPNASNANACAAPQAAPKAARPCGTPVYVGCDGTPGGNHPTPGGTYQGIAPGTGWPCAAPQAPKAAGPMKVVMAPVALIACLVKGLMAAGECFVTGGGI